MVEIKIIIKNLKKIKELEFILKLEKGMYAIIGNNGSGKSSLITCIAKLVKPSILKDEFTGNYNDSKITYINPYGVEIIWHKNPNWYAIDNNYNLMPKYKGFFESSILTGTRFFHLENKKTMLKTQDIETSKTASEFVKDNLDYIINGNKTNLFDNLYYTGDIANRIYYLKFNDKPITEFNMSTGEYFLLSVLKIIQTFSNRKSQDDLRLLIIDEIDIALHPLAQKRFIEKLKEWMEEFNLLIIFATHSLQILDSLDANDIYYLENDKVYNPIYPAFLTSKLFQHLSYDIIILVEDELASKFIFKILTTFNIERIAYKIIPIGGWEKVLEIYNLNSRDKYFGNAKVINILDGDIQSQANKNPYRGIEKYFLPFSNIERVCIELLFQDSNFKSFIENLIYPKQVNDLNVEELKQGQEAPNINELKTEHIKNIFKKLIGEVAKNSGKQEIEVKNLLIDYIFDKYKSDNKFIKFKEDIQNFMS